MSSECSHDDVQPEPHCPRCCERTDELLEELLAVVKAEYAICAPLSTRGRALAALIAKCEAR